MENYVHRILKCIIVDRQKGEVELVNLCVRLEIMCNEVSWIVECLQNRTNIGWYKAQCVLIKK